MIEQAGTLEKILFQNEDGTFTVAQFRTDDGGIVACGALGMINPGEPVVLGGDWELHPRFGRRFKVVDFRFTDPSSLEMIRKYLSSGFIKGVGPVTAERIVARFAEKTFEVMDKAPRRLLEVDGIGEARLTGIAASWEKQRAIRTIMIFLQKHGLSIAMATKIFGAYGLQAVEVIRENPYRMIRDIRGIGFLTADTIAARAGIPPDDPNRLAAIALHLLDEAESDGHTALALERLRNRFRDASGRDLPELTLDDLVAEGRIRRLPGLDPPLVAPAALYDIERALAAKFRRIAETPFAKRCDHVPAIMESALAGLPDLTDEQRAACLAVFSHKGMILTGGPGTGKTTTLRAILRTQRMLGLAILLAAPTGRAAHQMQEAAGHPAQTIHRLLGFAGAGRPQHNRDNLLPCHLLVVDETSMIDVRLMNLLLDALDPAAKLVLVGDPDQIPSVGAGNVLADLLAAHAFPCHRLSRIFRQGERSRIVGASHEILAGRVPTPGPDKELTEFYFVEADEPAKAQAMILRLVKERIPARFGLDPVADVQVLAPMYKGECGVDRLNRELQAALNANTRGLQHRGVRFLLGDRVINLENNYDKLIYNGDCGVVTGVDPVKKGLTVQFTDREATFESDELDALRLAYAVTIHKSQGSEYPAVVVPVLTEHYIMLKRNLLYTAVTRGRKLVLIVGQRKALELAVRQVADTRRETLLGRFLTGELE